MKRLDRYIASTVGLTMLLSSVGLLGILTIFTFLEQVEDMQNEYNIYGVLMFCLYSMPRMFYETIPYAALIGCLAGLGLMANNSELVVMRAAGVSTWSISWSAMLPTFVLVLAGLAVGEFILPDVERVARNDRLKALSSNEGITPIFGFWYREGNVYMHFDEVTQDGLLTGVTHYYFNNDNEMQRSLFAERAVFHDVRPTEKYWLLENVNVTDIYPDRTEVRTLPSLKWTTGLEPGILSTEILVQPDKMSIGELAAKIEYMETQGLNAGKFRIGYWRKVLQPIATVGLVFVAISFIFGPLRESTMGMRVVAGLIIGILFKFIQDLLSPASMVFGFSPFIATLVPILMCIGVGFYLLRRTS